MSDSAERFPSKRDLWLELLIWAGVLLCAATPVALRGEPVGPLVRTATWAGSLLAVAFMLRVLYGTHYRVHADRLAIRAGPFAWSFALAEIERIEPSRNPLSSPACSLDRLLVQSRSGRRVLISPRDKERFLRALCERDPELRVEGSRVVRGAVAT